MNPFADLFSWAMQSIIGLVSRSNGLDLPEAEYPKLKDRTPYPQDGPVEILPPIDDAKTAAMRKATDKEFWETL